MKLAETDDTQHMLFRLNTAFLTTALLCVSFFPNAQTKPTINLAPRCDLYELNKYFISILNREHQRVNPTAPPVRFDKGLLDGVLFHNRRLERADSLYHASVAESRTAENVLSLSPSETRDPLKLAEYIFARFRASPPHHANQMDLDHVWACISCTENYCVVRLSGTRAPATKKSRY